MKQNLYAWFFEGGVVGVPKRLLGLMEPLGLDFDDLGKIIYLLYAGTDEVNPTPAMRLRRRARCMAKAW